MRKEDASGQGKGLATPERDAAEAAVARTAFEEIARFLAVQRHRAGNALQRATGAFAERKSTVRTNIARHPQFGGTDRRRRECQRGTKRHTGKVELEGATQACGLLHTVALISGLAPGQLKLDLSFGGTQQTIGVVRVVGAKKGQILGARAFVPTEARNGHRHADVVVEACAQVAAPDQLCIGRGICTAIQAFSGIEPVRGDDQRFGSHAVVLAVRLGRLQASAHARDGAMVVGALDIDHARETALEFLDEVDAVVISDYDKGVLTPGLLQAVLPQARRQDLPVCLDPKLRNFPFYKPVTVITPNHHEAEAITRRTIESEATLIDIGHEVRRMLDFPNVLITRGEEGMSLFAASGDLTHIPTVAREVYDVTGAGDTVVATLAMALAAGASMLEAAILSNHAAGVVVGKVGTATARPQEVLASFS